MEKPQNRPGNYDAVVLSLGRIPRILQLGPIFLAINTPTLNPQLDLSLHHILIEAQMPLRRKQSLSNVHALHLGRGAAAPDVDIPVVLLGQEGCRG